MKKTKRVKTEVSICPSVWEVPPEKKTIQFTPQEMRWITIIGAILIIGSFAICALCGSKPQVITDTVYVTETKPSYDYLKSVTVYIYGESDDKAESSLILGLQAKENETQKWGGTGVVIKVADGYTYILTNNHVAGKKTTNPRIYIKTKSKLILTEPVAYHNLLDMAILRFKGELPDKQPIKGVASAKPQDRVFVVGHHLGRPYIYGEGVFAGYDTIYALIQIPCAYGNSGSGIFDKDGQLIALVFGVDVVGFFDVDLTHAVCVDGVNIQLFLKQNGLL